MFPTHASSDLNRSHFHFRNLNSRIANNDAMQSKRCTMYRFDLQARDLTCGCKVLTYPLMQMLRLIDNGSHKSPERYPFWFHGYVRFNNHNAPAGYPSQFPQDLQLGLNWHVVERQ